MLWYKEEPGHTMHVLIVGCIWVTDHWVAILAGSNTGTVHFVHRGEGLIIDACNEEVWQYEMVNRNSILRRE